MPLLMINNIEKFYKKSRIWILAFIAVRFYRIAEQYLSILNWKSSGDSSLTFILKKKVPMWSDSTKTLFENQTVLFIVDQKVFKISNKDIGINVSLNQPYYLTAAPEILYREKQTKFLTKCIYWQQQYRMHLEIK